MPIPPPVSPLPPGLFEGGFQPFGSLFDLHLPSGDELYDMLMEKIEPELTTKVLPLLDSRYKKETPAQAKERAKRYEKAFEAYEKALQEYIADLKRKLHSHQKVAMRSAEKGERQREEKALDTLESDISGA